MTTLDIEAVRAFVFAADLKNFTRAAEVLNTTQSAVSLKIKRLEERLGRRLIERTPRLVRLSAEGQAFLDPARDLIAAHEAAVGSFDAERHRLVLGIARHLVGDNLPILLKRMNASDPTVVLEMRVGPSFDVMSDFDRGTIDAAIVLQNDSNRRDGEILREEAFGWMSAPDFVHRDGEPLRLATQPEPCTVRAMVIKALSAAGRPWTEVFVGGGITTLGAAASAGLALAALPKRIAPATTVDHGPRLGLPPLPIREVALYSNASDSRSRAALKLLAAAFRAGA